MSLEKKHQTEVKHTLERFGGLAYKMVQDAIPCQHCGATVYPFHEGWPDYHGELPLVSGIDMAVKVEAKGGVERFEFRDLKVNQRDWLKEHPGTNFFWLQLGDQMVNTLHSMSRRVWMIPLDVYLRSETLIKEGVGVSYVPIHNDAIASYNMRFKRSDYTATVLFARYAMEWAGKETWRPNKNHPIWDYATKVTYDTF